ncbi:MAG: hypothetical protein GF313_02450 [Caldithrix sp.]|nr:hypothetical protein [Caldithrix sp.]
MPISGVVIMTQPEKTENVLALLNQKDDVTTYGVHKDYHIIAVLEADSSRRLEEMTKEIQQEMPGVLGIFPAYVNFENEVNET